MNSWDLVLNLRKKSNENLAMIERLKKNKFINSLFCKFDLP